MVTRTSSFVDAAERQCTGKRRHASKADAKRFLRQTQTTHGSRTGTAAYHCPHCGTYHVGNVRL